MEVADCTIAQNLENDGENKMLYMVALKQRDLDNVNADNSITAFRHPFLSVNSFALRLDIMENCSISIPVYFTKQHTNYMANI